MLKKRYDIARITKALEHVADAEHALVSQKSRTATQFSPVMTLRSCHGRDAPLSPLQGPKIRTSWRQTRSRVFTCDDGAGPAGLRLHPAAAVEEPRLPFWGLRSLGAGGGGADGRRISPSNCEPRVQPPICAVMCTRNVKCAIKTGFLQPRSSKLQKRCAPRTSAAHWSCCLC